MNSSAFGLLCFAKGGLTITQAAQATQTLSAGGGVPPALPELHLNIWERDTTSFYESAKLEAFLDVGLMFDMNEPAGSLELVFPWQVVTGDVIDLSDRVSKPDAISAVFNENWAITHGDGAVVSDPQKRARSFAIVKAIDAVPANNAVKPTQYGAHHAVSIDIDKLKTKAVTAGNTTTGNAPERVYIRLRIMNVQRDFYCVGVGEKSRWWVPSWQRTDVIDFRVNVRRGAPQGLATAVGGRFFEFSKVQLFLMRARDQDIVFQDAYFTSCRSLEDEDFWARYALKESATSKEITSNLADVKKSLGYQWKKSAKATEPVTEFGILARFKVVEFGFIEFVFVALILGGFGNGLWDLFKSYVWDPLPVATSPLQAVCVNAGDIVNQARQECLQGVKKR